MLADAPPPPARFGLGKVHQELLSQPPAAAATPIPVAQTIDEGEGQGQEQGEGLQVEPEGLPAIAPEEITKPLYRCSRAGGWPLLAGRVGGRHIEDLTFSDLNSLM